MRLLTFEYDGKEHAGVRRENRVIPAEELDPELPATLFELLANNHLPAVASRLAHSHAPGIALADINYRPLLPRPGKIACIGRNYAAHAAESGAEGSPFPEVFFRGATSLVAHQSPIIRPQCSDMLDFEGEFALVIGKTCRHATEENALEYVAGYTLFNDATIRNYQRFASQWTVGKNFDGTGALGPELVTVDEVPAGLSGCTLTTTLNGVLMQTGHVDDLIFPVKKLIQILSECMTLEPGDIVVTGTPSGVGFARIPPLWMKPGDTVEVEVTGLGKLVNNVIDEMR